MAPQYTAPSISIGALGGSGTRMVAQLFRHAGVFMGHQLNMALDNLDFTQFVLARSPIAQQSYTQFAEYTSQARLTGSQRIYLWHSAIAAWRLTYPYTRHHDAHWRWHLRTFIRQQYRDIWHPAPVPPYWGWKEPNTHIILPDLLETFPTLQYIHIIRHGLDMAFSSNRNQLWRWGADFGITVSPTDSEQLIAMAQLEYWIKTTERIEALQQHYPGRIAIYRLDDFWETPVQTINACFDHARVPLTAAMLDTLITIPQPPSDPHRYRQYKLSMFTRTQLDAVTSRNFEILT